jgi:hypothetical protein
VTGRAGPLTGRQLGAVHGEFRRLGFHPWYDRTARLELSAAVLGLDMLESTKSLTLGEAGQLVRALRDCRDVDGLYAVAFPAPEPRGLARVLAWLAA